MRNQRKQKGLTLIELLVVGAIILLLATISLPLVKPMIESQQTRSATQMVSTYLNRAKNRAKLTGRPCGVRFEVYPGTEGFGGAALILRQVDVPPLYTGFDTEVYGSVKNVHVDSDAGFQTRSVPSLVTTDMFLYHKLQEGDRVQFGGSGPFYRVCRYSVDGVSQVKSSETDSNTNTNYYRIFLEEPVSSVLREMDDVTVRAQLSPKTTMSAPIALPQGTVVDLQYSGFGDEYWNAHPAGDLTVMFSPSGEVSTVNGVYPTAPLFLLIGRWEQISVLRQGEDLYNYADGRNFWVSVNAQSGMVTTAEVNPLDSWKEHPESDKIRFSRQFAAQTKKNVGGY